MKNSKTIYSCQNLIKIMEKYETEDGLVFNLDTETFTAHLFALKKGKDFIIKKSVTYQSREYIITDILSYPQYPLKSNKNIKSISFTDDSELVCIHSDSFNSSFIESLSIPASLELLEDGWCSETKNLKYIKISPKNKNYMYIDNKMIIGKSDPKSDIYDVLSFVRRDAKEIKIPSFIKYIHSSTFDECIDLTSIEIPDDSDLFSIGKCAFSNCPIQKLVIPAKLEVLQEGWCEDLKNVEEIIVSPENKLFSSLFENCCLIGKSSIDDDNYSIFYYATKDIVEILFPSYIKVISSFAFENSVIELVDFEPDSQLTLIDSFAFFDSSLYEIKIPPSTETIQRSAFSSSSLENIVFLPKSKLSFIGYEAFESTYLDDVVIPSSVNFISERAFHCSKIHKLSFEENSNLTTLNYEVFVGCKMKNIIIPANIKCISSSVFNMCDRLISVEILSSSISIGSNCFTDCFSFCLISLPNAESINIDQKAFHKVSKKISLFICNNAKINIIRKK